MATTKSGSVANNSPTIGSTNANYRRLVTTFVGPSLGVGTVISGTVQIVIGLRENSGNANCYPYAHMYVMTSSGGLESTLLNNYWGGPHSPTVFGLG